MKSELSDVYSVSLSTGKDGDASKLMSLLALAAGALAMPQTSNADIIFVDLSTSGISVGANTSPSFLTDNLPGTARLGFQAHHRGTTSITSVRWVTAGQKAGYVRVKSVSSLVIPVDAGLTWDQVIGNPPLHPAVKTVYGFVATANFNGHIPNSFDQKYFPFIFKDSTQPGSPLRYGWIELNLSNPANGNGPDVTILGYAWDTTGDHLPTGTVPEPAPVALFALGALTLGAKGLRSWRWNRLAAR